jgi:ATP-dependent Clp protease, protease subunit
VLVLSKLKVDPVTRSRLGRTVLADVRARLWAIDCQTCGQPLHRDPPALVVDHDDGLATATLHHPHCRAPEWCEGTRPVTPTWRAAAFRWMPAGTPVFVVNPSCEATRLRWTGTNWVAADLDPFTAAGMGGDMARANRVEGLVVVVDQDRMTVELTTGGTKLSWVTNGPTTAKATDVLVAVTSRLDPASEVTADQLAALAVRRHAVFGMAAVRVPVAANSPQVHERLLQHRIIFLGAEVDDEIANRLTAQLLLLEAEDPTADITFYINSTGGSVSAGMAILDTMKIVKPDVATWVMGLAAGTAQVLLSAGAPGKRHALPKARVTLMLPQGPPNPDPLQREMLTRWTREIVEMIAADTGQPVERVRADAERRRSFTATEALEYGLVDQVTEASVPRRKSGT